MFSFDLSNLLLVTVFGLLELILKPGDVLLQIDILSIRLFFFFFGLLLIAREVVLRFVKLCLQVSYLRLVFSVTTFENEVPLFEDHRLGISLEVRGLQLLYFRNVRHLLLR